MILFYSRSRVYKELSNFYVDVKPFYIEKRSFRAGEYAFHYYKYLLISQQYSNSDPRKSLLYDYSQTFLENNYKTPLEAKKAGGKKGLLLNTSELEIWSNISANVQYNICLARIRSCDKLFTLLQSTGDSYLLHIERGRNPIWGGRISKETGKQIGQNRLGCIWMKLRDEKKI